MRSIALKAGIAITTAIIGLSGLAGNAYAQSYQNGWYGYGNQSSANWWGNNGWNRYNNYNYGNRYGNQYPSWNSWYSRSNDGDNDRDDSNGGGTGGGYGAHCGEFIQNAPTCGTGYHCQLNSSNPDTGGMCVPNTY